MEYGDLTTAEQLTADLIRRINENDPYPPEAGLVYAPYEPIVIVDEPILPYTNKRAVQKDGKWIIPVAIYDKNGGRKGYAKFEDCVKWSQIYGITNILVDKLSNYITIDDIL